MLAYTIAAEISDDIDRFPARASSCGYSGLCPRVCNPSNAICAARSPNRARGISRWALVEPPPTPAPHPSTATRYQATKARIGKQRGAKVAQIDLARRLSEAILAHAQPQQPFPSQRRHRPWPPDGP